MATNQLKNAIELAKSGDHISARQAFVAIIKTDPQEVLAWLWLVDLIEDETEKISVLERCQKMNPDDPMVRDALLHFTEHQRTVEETPSDEAIDVRAVYEDENTKKQKRNFHGWLKPVIWIALLSAMLTGLYFALPYLRNLELPALSSLDGLRTPTNDVSAAATWTPQSTATPTITPTGTPALPLGFGTPRPPAAAPISIWDADQLVVFSQWGNGALFGVQQLLDGSILTLSSRGYEHFSAETRQSLIQYKNNSAWQSAAVNPSGEWLVYASAEGIFAASSITMDRPVALENPAGKWHLLSISANADTAVAVNDQNEIAVWNLPSGELRFQTAANYGQIRSLAISPDGSTIAVGGQIGFVWLLNASEGGEDARFFDLEGSVNALAFSNDGNWLASAGTPQTIAVWDLKTDKIHHHIYQEIDTVTTLAFSPSGAILGIGLANGEILVWNDRQRQFQDQLSRHHAAILDFSFSPDESTLCSAAEDSAVLCWDLTQTLTYQTLYPNIAGSTFTSIITPNGKYLIMAGSGSQIHIFDLASETEVATLKGHLGSVYGLDVSADGKQLLSAGRDGTIRLWSLEQFEAIATLGSHAGFARSVTFSPDGSLAASAGTDEMVKLWDLTTMTERHTLIGHTAQVQSVSFSLDGTTLLSGSDDGSIRRWDVTDGRLLDTFISASPHPIYTVRSLPGGTTFLSGDSIGVVTVWNQENGHINAYLRGHTEAINMIASTADGSMFATGDASGKLIFWDRDSLERIRIVNIHTNPMVGLAFTGNSRAFFSIDRSGMVLRWDTAGLQPPAAYGDYNSPIAAAAIAPGGTLAAIAGKDRTIRLIDLTQGVIRYQIRGLEANITSLAFSPGGTHLAGGFADGSIQFWESSSGAEELQISGNANRVTALCFEPDGRVLLVGRANHIIERRDIRSGSLLETMIGHSGAITALQFAPNGVTLASGSYDGMVLLWDMDDNSILHRINAHSAPISGLQFAPNGDVLFSTAADGFIYAWRTTNAEEIYSFSSDDPHTRFVLDQRGELLISGTHTGFCFWNILQQAAGPCYGENFGEPAALQLIADNAGLIQVDSDGTIQLFAVAESHVPEQTPTPQNEATINAIEVPEATSAVSFASLPAPLYYLSDKSGSRQIWRLDTDGRTTRQITEEALGITAYDVSRSADHIVYVTGNDLILIDKAAQSRWVLVDGEDFPPTSNDARLRLEISSPLFSPDGWRIAYALNGIHIYSILNNNNEVLLENDLQVGSLDNTIYTPIFFSPGGNNLYVQQTSSTGMALVVLNPWTGDIYAGPLPGPCCQPSLNNQQDAVFFTGIDKYGSSIGLWIIDVWSDQLTELLPQPPSTSTRQVNAYPKQMDDGSLFFFYAQVDNKDTPPMMMAKAADDAVSLLQVVRADSYDQLDEALWADDGAFVLVLDPADGHIKKLSSTDTPPIILPISGTMMRWGE